MLYFSKAKWPSVLSTQHVIQTQGWFQAAGGWGRGGCVVPRDFFGFDFVCSLYYIYPQDCCYRYLPSQELQNCRFSLSIERLLLGLFHRVVLKLLYLISGQCDWIVNSLKARYCSLWTLYKYGQCLTYEWLDKHWMKGWMCSCVSSNSKCSLFLRIDCY